MSDRPIGVGVVGANPDRGWASRAHIPAIQASADFRLAAVATTRWESANAARDRFGADRAHADPASLAGDPEVDLVVVSVRVPAHYELIATAIDAGKHVWSDWPLALTADEAGRLAARADAAGIRHFVGLQARYAPAAVQARKLIDEGELGTVLSATLYSSRAKGNSVEVPAWTAYSYDENDRSGLVEVLGGHALDLMQSLLGPVLRLAATTAIRLPEHTIAETRRPVEVTAADHLVAAAELQGGALVSIHLHDGETAIPRTRLEVMGTRGDLAIVSGKEHDPWAAQLQISPLELYRTHGDHAWEPVQVASENLEQLPTDARNLSRLYHQVATDLRAGTHEAPDFHTAHRIHQLIESTRRRGSTP
jgi:predicted dehydrogenase